MLDLLLRFMGNTTKPVSGKAIVAYFNGLGFNFHQTGGTVGNAVKKGHIHVVRTIWQNGSRVNFFV
jgi:hypothetical protein